MTQSALNTVDPHAKTVLVVYNVRYVYPVVQSVYNHLYCWKKYSSHQVVYLNIGFGFPLECIQNLDIDAIIFHTSFLSRRWIPEKFQEFMDQCAYLKRLDCLKIAMPQDEFIHTGILNRFIQEFGVNYILTCAYEADWDTIYDAIDRSRVKLENTLTGYLDEGTVLEVEAMKEASAAKGIDGHSRPIDIGYRAWKAEYWLGEHGCHKVRVAEKFQQHPKASHFKFDISLDKDDTIRGMAWFDFLLNCKATIGVEGGASVLDRDGHIRAAVHRYLKDHPDAAFEEVRQACFPEQDHKLGLACLSPRHLEACITETCQFLIEGTYNGILKPWEHYVPIKNDYSNLDEVVRLLDQPDTLAAIAKKAYQDIVAPGAYTYSAFVARLDDTIHRELKALGKQATTPKSSAHTQAVTGLAKRDDYCWKAIQAEMQYRQTKRPFRKPGTKVPFLKRLYLSFQYKTALQRLKSI